MESVSLYSEARNEYLKQMSTWIVPPLVEFFRKEYNVLAQREGRRVMSVFQTWCAEIPRWNQDVIDTNVNELLDSCRCDYMEELMTAVFIAHTKMLTAIRMNPRQKKMQITLPKLDHFLHRVFVECARAFWKAPFLFSEDLSPIDKQKNVLQAEAMCTEALSGAVRSLLPVKSILRDNLDEDEEAEEVVESRSKHRHGGSKHRHRKHKKYVSDSSSSESSSDSEEEVLDAPVAAAVPVAPVAAAVVQASLVEPMVQVPLVEPMVQTSFVEPMVQVPVVPDVAAIVAPVVHVPVAVTAVTAVTAPVAVTAVTAPTPLVSSLVAPASAERVFAEPAQKTPVLAPASVKVERDQTFANPSLFASELSTSATAVPTAAIASEFIIDTEPSVRFTPYDTVYDENTPNVSEIRYAPKMSIEEIDPPVYGGSGSGSGSNTDFQDDWDDYGMAPLPRIQISNESAFLTSGDAEDLDGGSSSGFLEEEERLTTQDFEELA